MSREPQTKPKCNITARHQDWVRTPIKARLSESRREQEVGKEQDNGLRATADPPLRAADRHSVMGRDVPGE